MSFKSSWNYLTLKNTTDFQVSPFNGILAAAYYRELEKDPNVKLVQVSNLYANRGSSTVFRLYVEVEYHSTTVVPGTKLIANK